MVNPLIDIISCGASNRPMEALFSNTYFSHFKRLDLLEIDKFKQLISNYYEDSPFNPHGRGIYCSKVDCEMAEFFIMHPSEEFVSGLEENIKAGAYRLLPFFARLAIDNRIDLFENNIFLKLFTQLRKEAAESIIIATAFSNRDYVQKAVNVFGIDSHLMHTLTMIASAAGDKEMLQLLVSLLNQAGLRLKDISIPVNQEIPSYEAYQYIVNNGVTTFNEDALFWAIRCNQTEIVAFLLGQDIDPNAYREKISGKSYLHVAVDFGNLEIIKLLLNKGACLESKDYFQQTPLHYACAHKRWETAYELVKEYNADLLVYDQANKLPEDYIDDQTIRKIICPRDDIKIKCAKLITLGYLSKPEPKIKQEKHWTEEEVLDLIQLKSPSL